MQQGRHRLCQQTEAEVVEATMRVQVKAKTSAGVRGQETRVKLTIKGPWVVQKP